MKRLLGFPKVTNSMLYSLSDARVPPRSWWHLNTPAVKPFKDCLPTQSDAAISLRFGCYQVTLSVSEPPKTHQSLEALKIFLETDLFFTRCLVFIPKWALLRTPNKSSISFQESQRSLYRNKQEPGGPIRKWLIRKGELPMRLANHG